MIRFVYVICIIALLSGCRVITDRNVNKTPEERLPYIVPTNKDAQVFTLLSVGETSLNGYRMVGIPDGLGAFDNGDNTFTVLMHHEIGEDKSIIRTHGAKGAFISRWVITKPGHEKGPFKIISGEDAIKKLFLWDNDKQKYYPASSPLGRLCSADLAEQTAFYYDGLGTQTKLFLGGEENDAFIRSSYGRALATIINGPQQGQTYELPLLGQMSIENVVASPLSQKKTIAVVLDDSVGKTLDTLGEVYIYVGEKTNTGSPIERAGLTNGQLYALVVNGLPIEDFSTGLGENISERQFDLISVGDVQSDDGTMLFELSKPNNPLGITKFARPEDGAWDPVRPNKFYFTTTGARIATSEDPSFIPKAPGRLWELSFTNIRNPLKGGTIRMLLNGREGAKSLDNLTISKEDRILIQEDRGDKNDLSRIWSYDLKTRNLKKVAQFNPEFFSRKGKNFITTNEESSGIIDFSHILGPKWYLLTIQSHIPLSSGWQNIFNRRKFKMSSQVGEEVVEDGQLVLMYIP